MYSLGGLFFSVDSTFRRETSTQGYQHIHKHINYPSRCEVQQSQSLAQRWCIGCGDRDQNATTPMRCYPPARSHYATMPISSNTPLYAATPLCQYPRARHYTPLRHYATITKHANIRQYATLPVPHYPTTPLSARHLPSIIHHYAQLCLVMLISHCSFILANIDFFGHTFHIG